jgi:hypothetical protein
LLKLLVFFFGYRGLQTQLLKYRSCPELCAPSLLISVSFPARSLISFVKELRQFSSIKMVVVSNCALQSFPFCSLKLIVFFFGHKGLLTQPLKNWSCPELCVPNLLIRSRSFASLVKEVCQLSFLKIGVVSNCTP